MAEENDTLEFPVIANFTPEVPIEIYTIDSTVKVVAAVDTGSTGFLQIPLATGIKANLRLFGVGYYTMADGRQVKKIQAFGRIRFAGKDLFGIITLSETSDDCLLGMQFLARLGMEFTVSTPTKKAIFKNVPQPKVKEDKPKTQTTSKDVANEKESEKKRRAKKSA